MQFFQILNWLLCRVLLLTSQLDKNHISCIEEGAFRALRSLEVLWVSWWVQMKSRRSFISCWEDFDLGFSVSSTLNNNNISSIPVSSFNHMPKLRTLWVSAHRTTLPRMQDCSHGKQKRVVKNSRQILTNYFSPFSFFLSMFLNVFFLCCSFFVLLAFFLTPSFAIPSFLYPSLSPPIFPCLPFPVLYFIPRPSFPLTFLHSHLCYYPPQCINSFLPFLFLLPSPLSLPSSSSSSLLCPSLRLPPPSRLHSNSLRCDCHLAWLSPWLRQRAALGLYTQCSSPPSLRGLNLAELRKSDFACSGTAAQWHDTPVDDGVDIWTLFLPSYSIFSSLGHSGSAFVQPCSLASGSCPPMCSCSNNIVDCRGRGLTAIPAHLPEAMTEMWVSSGSFCFSWDRNSPSEEFTASYWSLL